MKIKSSLFTGGLIALLAFSTFTVGRALGRKPKGDWNAEGWLRLLSGANGVAQTQTGQASQPFPKPEVSSRAEYHLNIGALQAYRPKASQPDGAAEIIGRTGYPLYR
jgi:hypothetical protein